MLRRARNPLATAALVFVGAIIALATAAVVVVPDDDGTTPAQPTITATTVTTQPVAPATTVAPSTTVPPAPPTTTSTEPPARETTEAVPETQQVPLVPTRVRIDKLGVDASMIDLYKKEDNTLQVPEDIHITGWYTGRSVPGELGPSVVVGHVDSAAEGAGVFFRLRELEVGDLIEIDRSDGSVARFRVTDSELVLKTDFPTDKVYGSVEGSKLRLITCGGGFNSAAGSYLGNVIVYADHVGTAPFEWRPPSQLF